MTVKWEDVSEAYQMGLEGYKLYRELKTRVGEEKPALAEAMWLAIRHRVYAPGYSGWELLNQAPEGTWGGDDFLALLDLNKECSELSDNSYSYGSMTGWHYYLNPLFEAIKPGDTASLKSNWQGFEEPLRSALGFHLARRGHLKPADLPEGTLAEISGRAVRFWSSDTASRDEFQGLHDIWSVDVWGQALIDAALDPGCERFRLGVLSAHLPRATVEQQVEILLKVDSSDILEAVDLCVALGDAARGPLLAHGEALARSEATQTYRDSKAAMAVAVLSLWQFAKKEDGRLSGSLDPTFEWLLDMNHIFEPISEILASMPEERRRAALKGPIESLGAMGRWGNYRSEMAHLTALKTEEVCNALVNGVARLPKTVYESDQERFGVLLGRMGEPLFDPLMNTLSRSAPPMRHLLVGALADLRRPESIDTLLTFAGDKNQMTSEVAVKGLKAFDWVQLAPAVEKSLSARKKDHRLGAAALLCELPITEGSKALAQARLSAEKVAAVKQLLTQIIDAPLAAESDDEGVEQPHIAARAALDEGFVKGVEAELNALVEAHKEAGVWSDAFGEATANIPSVVESPLGAALVMSAWMVEGNKENHHNLTGWYTLLGRISDTPEAPHLAMELYASLSYYDRQYLETIESEAFGGFEALIQPALTLVEADGCYKREALASVLIEREIEAVYPLFVRGLGSSDKYERQWVERILTEKLGEKAAPHLWPLLKDRQAPLRLRAAGFLERFPTPESHPHLEEAVAKEGNKKTLAALKAALAACVPLEVVEEGADAGTDAALDAALSALPEAEADLPGFIDESALPDLRWRSGASVSSGARRWFISTVSRENQTRRSANLWRARVRLDPSASDALLEVITTQYENHRTNENRATWIYSVGFFANDTRTETFGEPMDAMARDRESTWAFHRVEALKRHAGAVAIYWLDVWGNAARSKGLRARAAEALQGLALEEGVSLGNLLQRARPPRHSFDDKGRRQIQAGSNTLELRLTPKGVECFDTSGKALSWRSLGRKIGSPQAKSLKPLREAVDRSLSLAVATLERAMVRGSAWSFPQWRTMFEEHPVLAACAPGVVFRVTSEQGESTLFTLDSARQRTMVDDAHLPAIDTGTVDIPHPLNLDEGTLEAWQSSLVASNLEQPFEQIERECFRHDPEALDPFNLALLEASPFTPSLLLRLTTGLGYQRGPVEDGGFFYHFTRTLAEGHTTFLNHDGLPVEMRHAPSQLEVTGFGVLNPDGESVKPADMPPLVYSEALRDLTSVVG